MVTYMHDEGVRPRPLLIDRIRILEREAGAAVDGIRSLANAANLTNIDVKTLQVDLMAVKTVLETMKTELDELKRQSMRAAGDAAGGPAADGVAAAAAAAAAA